VSLLAYAAIALAIFAAGAAGGVKWHAGQDAIKENLRLEQEAKERGIQIQRIDTASVSHEADKRQIQTKFRTITKEVERVVEKPVYRDECFDADGMRALGAAIHPAAAASEPKGAVPRPDGAK
jgi:hypothetical protein